MSGYGVSSAVGGAGQKTNALGSRRWVRRAWSDRIVIGLMVPGVVFYLAFFYVPLLGNVVAFQDYVPFVGFINSPFVGLQNFDSMLSDPDFWQSVVNTFEISALQLFFFFPAPILLALLLNSLLSNRIRQLIQSVVYLPHFISWVIIVAIFDQILGGAGVVNQALRDHALPTLNVIGNPVLFKPLITSQVIWQATGWGTIIFLAAMANVDPNLHEAAAVDGAGNWRRIWHVTIPSIKGVTILLLILRLGGVLNVDFQQILLQQGSVGPQAAEVLNTYVYFNGIVGGEWGLSTAVGLVQGVVGALLVYGANKVAHVFGEPGIYQ